MKVLSGTLTVSAVLLAMSITSQAVRAQCCSSCGCANGGQKQLKLVKKEKEITVVCWSSECGDVVMPGHCCKTGCMHCVSCDEDGACGANGSCGGGCSEACGGCQGACNGSCGGRGGLLGRHLTETCIEGQEPGCPTLYSKKDLLRKEVKKKVPVYVWELVDVCSACSSGGAAAGAGCVEGAPAAPAEGEAYYAPPSPPYLGAAATPTADSGSRQSDSRTIQASYAPSKIESLVRSVLEGK